MVAALALVPPAPTTTVPAPAVAAVPAPAVVAVPPATPPALPPLIGSGTVLLTAIAAHAKHLHDPMGKRDAKKAVYEIGRDGNGQILDIYTGKKHAKIGDGHDRLSVEHVWPKSLGPLEYPARYDLHHLMPTHAKVNSYRDRLPFGMVKNADFDTKDKWGPASSRRGTDASGVRVWEPQDEVKGDIARAMLYMLARYGAGAGQIDTGIVQGRIDTLLGWAANDPPSAAELKRNADVAKLQGNANPFISHPDLAKRVGSDGFKSWLELGIRTPIAA